MENQSTAGHEVPFSFDELFFSRTDERGIILSGNSVFRRISRYSWKELSRRPHNIIRHPDMPKAVFWLLWDTIKKGEPIGAYVKNQAKDGRHYWVFAIVTPIEGGYLSVRLKPSGGIFSVVEREYANLVAAERENRLAPAESGELLLARLQELGFRNYGVFMAIALSEVIATRDQQIGRPLDKSIARFADLVGSAQSLLAKTETVFRAYEKSKYVPLNLRVQAAQLGSSGASISVIAEYYSSISGEIKNNMDTFITAADQVLHTISSALFLICVARVQGEVLEFFHGEAAIDGESKEEEIGFLEQQQHTYQRKAVSSTDGLPSIARQSELFHRSCEEMTRLAAALQVTRIMGKVESAGIDVERGGPKELIDDLDVFQKAITEGLKDIEQVNRNIQRQVGELLVAAAA